jgi:1,4-dihydroxy-2-naphthoate octaprenyltransferase
MDFDKFINIVKLGRVIAHAAIMVYVLGALFAVIVGASFEVVKFIFGYVILFSGILAAVYKNNYHDIIIDKYSPHTFFSGGSNILIEHPELMGTTRMTATVLFGVSILLGFVCMLVFSYPVTFFLYVLAGNFIGWCYTSPPLKLVYRGFGELTTMVGAGFIIPGFAYFLLRGTIDVPFVLFSIPLMLIGFPLSLYLELPDRHADSHGQKRTFVVRRGERLGFLLAALSSWLVFFCYVLFALFRVIAVPFNFWFLASFSVFPALLGTWSLLAYANNPRNLMTIVFRAATCIFVLYILIDFYLLYVVLL